MLVLEGLVGLPAAAAAAAKSLQSCPTLCDPIGGSPPGSPILGLPRTIQLQLLQHYWLGHRLGLL